MRSRVLWLAVAVASLVTYLMVSPSFSGSPGKGSLSTDVSHGATGAERSAAQAQTQTSVATERASALSSDTGTLQVNLLFKSDGTPAADVPISLAFDESTVLGVGGATKRTDANGCATFESIAVGSVLASIPMRRPERLRVYAHQLTSITLMLDDRTVNGLVREPSGVPASFARIWVSSKYGDVWQDPAYAVVGRHWQFHTEADHGGRFSLRMGAEACVAANKDGFGWSQALFPFMGKATQLAPAMVELRLAPPCGPVTVSVLAGGGPVEGAEIIVGHRVSILEGGDVASFPAQACRTGPQGLASFHDIPRGRWPVRVSAVGYAPWSGEVKLPEDGGRTIVASMPVEGAIMGVISDCDGNCLANVHVQVDSGGIDEEGVRTRMDGSFHLRQLQSGSFNIVARHRLWGEIKSVVHVVEGGTTNWTPRMPPRGAIRGNVVLASGKKFDATGTVMAHSPSAVHRVARASIEPGGAFVLEPIDPDREYTLRVEVPTDASGLLTSTSEGARSGVGALVVLNDTGPAPSVLSGLVVLDGAGAARHYALRITTTGGAPATSIATDNAGGFSWFIPPRLANQRCTIEVMSPSARWPVASAGPFLLASDQSVDVGTIVVPQSATLSIVTDRQFDGVFVELSKGSEVLDIKKVASDRIEWAHLAPGLYCVATVGEAVAPAGCLQVRLTAGSHVVEAMAANPCRSCEVILDYGNYEGAQPLRLCAYDASGRLVLYRRIDLAPIQQVGLPDTARRIVVEDEVVKGATESTEIVPSSSIRVRLNKK